MRNEELILVSHHLCPYVQRAAIALAEKGVPFERRVIDLAARPDWFEKISPLGKVPLLIVRRSDGGEAAIFESAVICEYLEDTLPAHPLHPVDPLERARHRAWMEFGSAILGDIWRYETAKDANACAESHAAMQAKFARVEAEWSGGPFFGGRRFCLVDAVFAPIFRYFEVFERLGARLPFQAMPHLMAWRAELARRPSVGGAVGEDYGERLLQFLARHDAHVLKMAA